LKLRGYLALGILFVSFPLLDLFQRTVLVLWVTLRPSRRLPAMARWIDFMAGVVVNTVTYVGGAKIQLPPRVVPIEPGTLIVMNHQSVLDIPLTVRSVEWGGYPRIVTRARYHRFIPLISHMVRLYQYPVVDPTARPSDLLNSIESLGMEGRGSPVPIAIFPEGTRTKDGEVGRFKKRGLQTLLGQRDWTVYLFVVDGYWKTAKLKHFVSGMSHIDGRIRYLGTAEWTDPEADPDPFILELRDRIAAGLDEMRGRDTARA
jgi:1-acyl-sn-glycerol-3-phosphate acyltransferase